MAEENGMDRRLIIRGGALGDLVLTIPLIRAVKAQHPDTQVELLGYPETAQFLVDSGLIARAHRVDAARFARLFSGELDPQSETTQWLGRFAGVISVWRDPERKIYRAMDKANIHKAVHIEPIPPNGDKTHAADFMLEQYYASNGGRGKKDIDFFLEPLAVPEENLAWAHRYVRENLHIGNSKIVLIHPGSGGRGKNRNWPPERFAELIDLLVETDDIGVAVLRGPADERAVRSAIGACKANAPVASGLNMSQLAALLSYVDAYAGNDSGVSHLSAAVGIHTVAIFGETDADIWAPRGKEVKILPATKAKRKIGNIMEVTVDNALKALKAGL